MRFFGGELLAARRSQFVIARFAIVVGDAPFRLDQTLGFQSVERGIELALLNVQNIFRHLMNPIRNREAVPRIVLERFKDQHIQRAVNEVGFLLGHKIFQA
jgi:hypothetical protein